ncbi:ribosome-associated protein [Alteromonas aestuariivivens]|uniref:Dual-action ribosomal maturation protein DarP n=1 Tax=Alteromonas aestuariivivens TaxID=1938339 RepID=A0A3D8M7G2_9ALTE|nr:ribosome biogenesis factor YjgA [Alteromonas aestuariivivens]RDV25563.1 ribosome-associated protein [Alteromonas aestuariivivens]
MSDHKHHSEQESFFEEEAGYDYDEPLSKTELKRQSERLQKLGEELVNLSAAHLATIPMDDELADAVNLARNINRKKDGYRRQLQFIGKLMRQRETDEIEQALASLTHQHQAANAAFHELEKAREAVIQKGDSAIQTLIEQYPELDRQKLRQFHRQVKKEREKSAPPKAFRELFQYLKEIIQP